MSDEITGAQPSPAIPSNTGMSSDALSSEVSAGQKPVSEMIQQIGLTRQADSIESNAAHPENLLQTPVTAPTMPSPPDPLQERINALERIIVSDPTLRDAYLSHVYGIPPQEAPSAPISGNPKQKSDPAGNEPNVPVREIPFTKGNFDSSDPHQWMKMFDYALSPYADFLSRQQAQEQAHEAQSAQERSMQESAQADQMVRQCLESQLPGFQLLCQGQSPTLEENTLLDQTEKLFTDILKNQYPREVWTHPKVVQDVVMRIAPAIQQLAGRLGFRFNKADTRQSAATQAMAREMYVESSSAVPMRKADAFEDAYKRKSIAGMIDAIENMKNKPK